MATTKLIDFLDIVDAVCEELKIQSTDVTTRNRVKRIVNEIYIQEVVPFARWKWLEGSYSVTFPAAYAGGYASVTPNSTTITLSTAPSVSLGSFAGKFFATQGFDEVYTIASHTTGDTTVVLNTPYLGPINALSNFKIWTDKIALPSDCRETVTVWNDIIHKPMTALGLQKFREISLGSKRAEGYPRFYYTGDFKDPSSGTGETESDRYRELRIHPSVNMSPVTINVDYVREVADLVNDGDEPVMPVEDRIILKLGALKVAWRTIARNLQEADYSANEFNARLARMAGKIEDTQDMPRITTDSTYIKRRRAGRYSANSFLAEAAGSGGGTYGAPTYLENVTINGATVTNNITVATGKTIDGVDLSVLAESVADLEDAVSPSLYPTTVTLLDNTAVETTALSLAASNTFIDITYSLSRGAANIAGGNIIIVNDGTNAAISETGTSLGTPGITFTASVSGANVLLLYTSTSTGTDATLKYTYTARQA